MFCSSSTHRIDHFGSASVGVGAGAAALDIGACVLVIAIACAFGVMTELSVAEQDGADARQLNVEVGMKALTVRIRHRKPTPVLLGGWRYVSVVRIELARHRVRNMKDAGERHRFAVSGRVVSGDGVDHE